MDAKDISDFDQHRKFLTDELPSMTGDLVDGWMKAGFTREESLEFARVWMQSTLKPTLDEE